MQLLSRRAARNVWVRIGEPVDLAKFIPDYMANPHCVRHLLADQLRSTIQALVDEIVIANTPRITAD